MKFAEHLSAHITPEWRKQYIHYEDMKARLYEAMEQAPSFEAVEPEVLARYYAKFDEKFFQFSSKELTMINTFYSEKLAEATRKFAALVSELEISKERAQLRYRRSSKLLGKKEQPTRKLADLKLAFSEFYLSLILLQNYQNLNFTGFRKILKKHDKILQTENGARWRIENVESAPFYTNKEIDHIIQQTEAYFTNELEGGDRQKAMKRLRVPPLGEQQSPWTVFKVGFFSGGFIVLVIAVILSSIFHRSQDDWRIIFRLYRAPLLITLFLFLMGINVHGWRSSGVNHVLIFELDPRNHLLPGNLMELAAVIGLVWSISVLCFLYSPALGIPAYANPLALVITMIVFMLNPTNTFMRGARFWFLRILGRAVCAPFFFVNFADFWMADQLNSLIPALLDFQYMICFYATNQGNWDQATDYSMCVDKTWWIRPIVACFPAWCRLAQCFRRYRDTKEKFPHLANAAKYATTFFVVIFSTLNIVHGGINSLHIFIELLNSFFYNRLVLDYYVTSTHNPYFYLWIVSSVVSSLYAYIWDIKMDWGLFDKNAGENRFLREEIVYSHVVSN